MLVTRRMTACVQMGLKQTGCVLSGGGIGEGVGETKASELVKTLSRDCEEWHHVSWPEETAGIENRAEITEGIGR